MGHRANHWKRPDVALIAALLEFADSVESDLPPPSRRRAVETLDRAAARFELEWHRVNRTGINVTDRQLRAWAGRIRAETRELQRAFAFGPPSREVLLLQTYELIRAVVNRYMLADHENTWVRHGSWRKPPTTTLARLWVRGRTSGRYVLQCLLAAFIAAAAAVVAYDD
jgi:sirohydrochlorin ferrochelatase